MARLTTVQLRNTRLLCIEMVKTRLADKLFAVFGDPYSLGEGFVGLHPGSETSNCFYKTGLNLK